MTIKKLGKDKTTILIILIILIILGIVFVPKFSRFTKLDNTNNNQIVINNEININNDEINNGGEEENNMAKVKLTTNHGEIVIQLYDDMPITTENFKNLVETGVYNNVIFHRIIDGFMIQGGDPTGTGYGDPSIPNIQDEFTHAGGNKNNKGTISMANAGPNTGSSQFFINLIDNNFLDDKHPAFGEVVEGKDIVDAIAKVETGANDKPVKDVIIERAEVI